MNKSVGAIIGFGNMGKAHYRAYRELDTNVIVVDDNPEVLAEARALEIESTHHLVDISQPLSFVDICTPTDMHARQIELAMYYNVPILVEKPIVRTKAEVKILRTLLKSYLHPVFVGEVEQYNSDLKPVLEYEGYPKKIDIRREVNLDFFLQDRKAWFLNEERSGGIILDLMIHDINILVCKYGLPTDIKNVELKRNTYDCPDEATVTLNFGGIEANLYASWVSQNKEHPIKTTYEVFERHGKVMELKCNDYSLKRKSTNDPFLQEIYAFLHSIQTKKTPYRVENYLNGIDLARDIIARTK